jgi:hypothetical protein
MKSLATAVLTVVISSFAFAQGIDSDLSDTLGLARLKPYAAGRATSGNKFVASNDDSKRIMPGETLVLADVKGAGVITHLWYTAADNEFGWPRLLRLRVYYDGKKTPSVDAPIGDFFGVGHGAERNLNSMMIRNSSWGRAHNSYWPMPYRKACRITVTNEGNRLVPMFYYQVDYRVYPSLPADIGYFHAYYRQERPARSGKNYEFVNIKNGSGHYVGTVMSVVQTMVSWFGEGDDLFYVDGAKKPQLLGTGSEDYFNDAWGLRDSDGPWTGTPLAEGERLGSRLTGYRWHVPDPIPFTKSLWAGIEHAGWTANPDGSVRSGFEERPDFFSSVAFWYQKGVNEDLPEPPYGQERLPFGNAIQLGIQNFISDVTTEKGKASVLKEVDWAKDLLYLEAEGPDAKINIPIDIPEDGQYELIGLIAQAPNYGDYKATLDGEPMNLDPRQAATSEIPFPGPEIFQNYLPEVYVAKDRALGMATLKKGRHTLTFICVGKDTHSLGYNFGINDVVLERVMDGPEQATEKAEEEPKAGTPVQTGVVFRGRPLSEYVAKAKSSTGERKIEAVFAIGDFGPDAAPAAAFLGSLLSDSSVELRIAAATSLAKIGPGNSLAVPQLSQALADSNERVRSLAAMALQATGPGAGPAVPQLSSALNDPSAHVRYFAAAALAAIGPQARPAVPEMAKRLSVKDESGFVFGNILYALGSLGPNASAALPELRQIAKDRKSTAAERAIAQIEGKEMPATFY